MYNIITLCDPYKKLQNLTNKQDHYQLQIG